MKSLDASLAEPSGFGNAGRDRSALHEPDERQRDRRDQHEDDIAEDRQRRRRQTVREVGEVAHEGDLTVESVEQRGERRAQGDGHHHAERPEPRVLQGHDQHDGHDADHQAGDVDAVEMEQQVDGTDDPVRARRLRNP